MEIGNAIKIAIRRIGNGYLVQLEKGEGYDTAESALTFYSDLEAVRGDLSDMIDAADALTIAEYPSDDEIPI